MANLFPSMVRAAPALKSRARCGTAGLALILLGSAGLCGTMRAQSSANLPAAPSAIAASLAGNGLERLSAPGYAGQAAAAPHFAGGVIVQPASSAPLALSIDDAIDRAAANNLQVLLANQADRAVRGQISTVFYALLPNMTAKGYTNAMEVDLAALGFKPSSLAAFGFAPGSISTIVKVDTTDAQLSANQVLFNLPDFYLYAAAKKAQRVADMDQLNTREGVIEAVATQYLAALADQAQIANAEALLSADQEVLRQATLSHEAGVGINLDVLRAKVELQNEQQALLRSQNTFAKDKIALDRLMGLPAGQELTLTDSVPFAELAEMPLDQTRALAYQSRKDLLALEAQLEVAERSRKAARYERMPSLSFNGYYGVLGETHGNYHGVFTAQGVLKIPIFEEGRFRGESEAAAAQEVALRHQIESLRATIDEQIRASRLDVESSEQLVMVARSNVDLATQALSDSRDRFASGVDDNLPVVQAQATLEDAQSRLISAEFQFNQSKLQLARNTGVVGTQYKQYLGR